MKKLATFLVSTALVGGLSFAAVVPASAADSFRGMHRSNFAGQHMPQGYGMWNVGPRGDRGMDIGLGRNQFVHFVCSADGAPLAELMLNHLSDRLTLEDSQTPLFNDFKAATLTAQTDYADACTLPTVNANAPLDPVAQLKHYETNATARIAAVNSVLPSLEALYDSLTDAQKAALTVPPGPRDARTGQWFRGMRSGQAQFGPGNGQGYGPNNGAPGTGQGYGPGNGQGYGSAIRN